jgi:hypothetical protein
MVLPVADLGRPWRLINIDLGMLLLPVVAVAFEKVPRQWPVLLVYISLGYLALRMIAVARANPGLATQRRGPGTGIPRGWLVVGIAALAFVHISWAVQSGVSSDIGEGGINGAMRIVHGQSLYGREAGTITGVAEHTDTYGPFNYEAYVPLATGLDKKRAALLTTLFFDLLTALLLFALGRRARGTTTGILLAYCWLAFPLTLYEDALGFNDSIVGAALVATVLVAHHPARRGAAAAVAVCSKLTPLALLPLLASYDLARGGSPRRLAAFGAAFLAATTVIFVPALTHSSVATFVSRTLGFQAGREASHSLWNTLEFAYAAHVAWLQPLTRVVHGLLTGVIGAFVVLSFRLRYRHDASGLAAMSAAILIAIQVLLSYYSYSYILWFAPLVLAALLIELPTPSKPVSGAPPRYQSRSSATPIPALSSPKTSAVATPLGA